MELPKHGISVRVRTWCYIVSGFEDDTGSGELQKYHVLGLVSWLKKHGISIRVRTWCYIVSGFEDDTGSGELQKYHVLIRKNQPDY